MTAPFVTYPPKDAFQVNSMNTAPAYIIAAVTKANTDLTNGTCRALLVGTAGDANLMDGAGNIVTGVPLQQGYNPLNCKQVRTGGTADNIWAIY